MASPIEVKVPDIGGFKDVNVIDVLVKDGQQIEKETPLVTIETEKAAMDVPSPVAGKIAQVKLKTGDKVSEGSLILLIEPAAAAAPADKPAAPAPASAPTADKTVAAASSPPPEMAAASGAASNAVPSATPAPAPNRAPPA
ncbi:MAG: dihydrolipoamide acetyltransferase, partial [Pseudomonadota bacterium]|nr:dihydrolipoamide acetyltransferase [Pseudomonadota bacterium]